MEDAKVFNYYNIGGINTYVNPLSTDGQLIHSVNMTSFPYGAKTKRTGYSQFLGTPDASQVQSLFQFSNIGDNPSSMNLYRASGSSIYYSAQGTGAWTLMGNGTISNGAHFGQVVNGTTLIGGDGVGSTRHTTDGTSFTNTTLAPIASDFEEYQGRIYANGTSSDLFYSVTNDPTNWNLSGTSDSSSFKIPGAGKIGKIFKNSNQLVATKTSGIMNKWDGYTRLDMSTMYGPSSQYSVAKTENYNFFINQFGLYGYGGGQPELLSNAVQRQFYNNNNSGISGSIITTIPAITHRYDYLASIGTITDDFTSRQIPNCILKYDYQKNEFLNWSFAHNPTSYLSYRDTSGTQQLLFGDASGQCYQMDNSSSDNGTAIFSEMVFIFHAGRPEYEKKWNWWRGMFNPGCQAKIQVACSNSYSYQSLIWKEVGDCSSGLAEFRFPSGSRSRFLFVRIYEASKDSRWSYYGCSISSTLQNVLP